MNLAPHIPAEILDQIALEQAHFSAARAAFFSAWQHGVKIAGPRWFGDGTPEGLLRAASKWDLCPNMPLIDSALGVLSSGERLFLSAMVSFYNAQDGSAMLSRIGYQGLADLGGLDLERRKVISELVLNYGGW
ncbi:TPA: hypothetical protein L4Q76_001690 [Pseudomonas aeruginosa]|uniref:hypothetical protein n=1 Tax=Pseudomonas aeruginosa TaxID=287 RepID=UPI0003B98537|nr:hypothetical protein [Pseudomonas aeruginosa]EKT9494434.1 hypothetical protein [Pseudomonas aeruginosa]ERY35626.1 hypothetical protein Q067_02261 [Pseudomonas aeruginosa BL13]MBH4028479.1 hypothetical protein [Pseudomonas aeruginosa]MBV5530551.1 hypothetical protein [Pseudomonas aeruginosa]MCS8095404.1 hypothetical protein [Pseudomonas aeruginosa]